MSECAQGEFQRFLNGRPVGVLQQDDILSFDDAYQVTCTTNQICVKTTIKIFNRRSALVSE